MSATITAPTTAVTDAVTARTAPSGAKAKHKRRSLPVRLGGWTVNIAMVALLLAAVAYVIPSFLGYQRYIITSGSMTGTYDQGSIVFDKVEPVADLRVGDVITYLPPPDSGVSNLVTHRIHRITHDEQGREVFKTKGDFNPAPDPWTFTLDKTTQPVVGFHVAHAGWVFLWLANPQHRMLLIGLPAGLVALMSLGEAFVNARAAGRKKRVEALASA